MSTAAWDTDTAEEQEKDGGRPAADGTGVDRQAGPNGPAERAARASGLPAYRADEPAESAEPAATGGSPAGRLPGRRLHALGVCALVLATLGFGIPLGGEIRARVKERVGPVSDGAIDVGTGIAWSTTALANIVTLGVLGVLVGVLGAIGLRHLPLPGERQPRLPGDFTALRRAFTLGWIAFVLTKLTCWTLTRLATGGSTAWAVPSVTHLDAWLPLLPCTLLVTGRVIGASRPRAAAVAAGITTLYATALWSLPS
ncbi:hypothetical protein GA0115233_101558 [Streptomyces sp. DI166]|uniref:hypothetical protein n=1 Tax=Streptomyces sp. DI166 TaxID=1839783 RepID=UPI0007F3D5D7|nr:hypothetical protein [Streptomyces sp. DI166]SBT90106.1 hypothetical protein GA0115233_101558 [Streptomyces sp. DI166]